jgi:hypothetical protein
MPAGGATGQRAVVELALSLTVPTPLPSDVIPWGALEHGDAVVVLSSDRAGQDVLRVWHCRVRAGASDRALAVQPADALRWLVASGARRRRAWLTVTLAGAVCGQAPISLAVA